MCYENRSKIIEYVTNKYGKNYVSTVIADGHMTCSNVVRKVLSAYNYESNVINTVSTKYIPDRLGITLPEALEESDKLKEFFDSTGKPEILRDCLSLEGNISHFSKHAAGVIISSKPIYECVPVMRDEDDHSMMKTQWDKKVVEKQGLIKFDFLGLKQLTVYGDMLKNIKKTTGKDITIDELYEINLEDKGIYEYLNNGDLLGVFQFSEYAGKETIKNAHPQCFEDVVACESICRPGVKEDKDYIANKCLYRDNGSFPIPSYWSFVKDILNPTYGAIIYQEQTMMIFNQIGDFTLGEADKLRKVKSLEPYRPRFVINAIKKGMTKKQANELFNRFDLGYSFNKSHAGVYAIHSCLTAYCLKYHYIEYMSAFMNMEMLKDDKKSKIMECVASCKKHGVKFLPPDINNATNKFIIVDKNTIMLPITFIKGLGGSAVDQIIKHRPYVSFEQFLTITPRRKVNLTSLKKLIKAGSFDCFSDNRQLLIEKVDSKTPKVFFDDNIKMMYEREVLGMNIGKHPLDDYHNLSIENFENGSNCELNVIVNSVVNKIDKKGNMMCFLKVENKECSFECIVFSRLYEIYKTILFPNIKLKVQGKIDNNKMLISKISCLK